MSYNIAIDGPAGAGKSTIAKIVANKLGFIYVDTGAMYRAMALYFLRKNVDFESASQLKEACDHVEITLDHNEQGQIVILNGENVNGLIRTEEVGKMASVSAANSSVRAKLADLQRELARKKDVVMDGRDIGTSILPNADLKIYLTASTKTRANRRYLELKNKQEACDIDEIEKDIIERDHRDMTREIAPLKQAEDAILIDSSDLNIDEVVNEIIEQYHVALG